MKRYYFDYAASTPVDPGVVKAMAPYWAEQFGNPGSLHSFGQEASAAVFEARDAIAKSLGCHYSEIIFTGSATEANNLALRGAAKAAFEAGIKNPKIITSAIEHDSILDTARDLEKGGVEVVYLPVSKNGIVDSEKLKAALDERTVLVSIMYANNEIGVVQPIAEIAKIVSDFRSELRIRNNELSKNSNSIIHNSSFAIPFFHTDAVQAFNYLNCKVDELGVDMLTLSSQKIYGPKGIGLLYARQNHESGLPGQGTVNKVKKNSIIPNSKFLIRPMITGGGQERGLRSGTENVPGIIGFAKAVELTDKIRDKESKRLLSSQEYFLKQVKKINSKIELNGDSKNRLPNNINLYIPSKSGDGGTAQDLVIALDLAGFAVSPGSACSARVCSPSHVLKALGYSDDKAMSGLRITFGRQTDKSSIDVLLKELKKKLG